MSLEILHNKATTHENEQFRRVSLYLEKLFQEKNYSGLLIGNPFNGSYKVFRPDAILFYDNGVVVIDFKDYAGKLYFSSGEEDFKIQKWYMEVKDGKKIEVLAGANYKTPYSQLATYRRCLKTIINDNKILKRKIDGSRICAVNIFAGPIETDFKVPGKYPYYKVTDEAKLGDLLYDLNNDNAYDAEVSAEIKKLFPACSYQKFTSEASMSEQIIKTEPEVNETIHNFLNSSENILVLASIDANKRDDWIRYLYSIVKNYNIPEVHSICHSTRISNKLQQRGIDALSAYSVIYGGSEQLVEAGRESEIRVVPIRSDNNFDEGALIIVPEAHLINRDLRQNDLLRFGTGRLLEDFFTFFNLSLNRKIIFIGDPFMLSYGGVKNSAMSLNTLRELTKKDFIRAFYSKAASDGVLSSKEKQKIYLAKSINQKLFNNLSYDYSDGTIKGVDNDETLRKVSEWFSKPLKQEPEQAVLFYKREDAQKMNLWIKENCLKNGQKLASRDLLLLNNNVNILDSTGLNGIQRILNGSYFIVEEILDKYEYSIHLKGREVPTNLTFTKIRAACLSQDNKTVEVWLVDNYLEKLELSKDEEVALQILSRKYSERLEGQEKNLLFAKYGWATTVHKAVGSTFKNIILKGSWNEHTGVSSEEYFRWLYSAFSATKETVFLTSPAIVNPFKNCQIVDNANSSPSFKPAVLVYEDHEIEDTYLRVLENRNVATVISKLSKQFAKKGYSLGEIKKYSDYLTKVSYTKESENFVVNIYNKGVKEKYGVSNIAIETTTNLDVDQIQLVSDVARHFFESSKPVPSKDAPDYIRDVCKTFTEGLKTRGVDIKHESSGEHQELFLARTQNGTAKLRLWYGTSVEAHTKGFISKIEIFSNTDPEILEIIKEYINDLR